MKSVVSLLSTAIDRHRIELVITQAEAALARAEAAEAAKQDLETEIIERQRVEMVLRESEERYALAASGANDGLWDRLQQELKAPLTLAGQDVVVNASIGLVLDVLRYSTKEELLRDADTRNYASMA